MNSNGPKTESWGTPLQTGVGYELLLFTETVCTLSLKNY